MNNFDIIGTILYLLICFFTYSHYYAYKKGIEKSESNYIKLPDQTIYFFNKPAKNQILHLEKTKHVFDKFANLPESKNSDFVQLTIDKERLN